MYKVILMPSGLWSGQCRIQDGTEYHEAATRREATRWVIKAAKAFNGTVITAADIEYLELYVVTEPRRYLKPLKRKRK